MQNISPVTDQANSWNICSLPEEIQVRIFQHLSPTEVCSAARVCKMWNAIAEDNLIWKPKMLETWPKCQTFTSTWMKLFRINRLYRKPTAILFDHNHFYIGYNKCLLLWENRAPYHPIPSPIMETDHNAPITVILRIGYLASNRRIVTGSADGMVKLWKEEVPAVGLVGSQKELVCHNTILGHADAITAMLIKRKWIVIGSADAKISIWENNVANEAINHYDFISKHTDSITALQSGPDFSNTLVFYSASKDRTINVWKVSGDEKNAICLQTIKDLEGSITCFAWSGFDKFIYGGTTDNKIFVWEINFDGTLKQLVKIDAHDQQVTCLGTMRFSSYFLSGSDDGKIKIWKKNPDKEEWDLFHQILPFPSGILHIKIIEVDRLRNAKKLVVVCKNKEIHLFNCAPLPTVILPIQVLTFKDREEF